MFEVGLSELGGVEAVGDALGPPVPQLLPPVRHQRHQHHQRAAACRETGTFSRFSPVSVHVRKKLVADTNQIFGEQSLNGIILDISMTPVWLGHHTSVLKHAKRC